MHVRAVRSKLKETYCIGMWASERCAGIGKKRIIKYANLASKNPDLYYQDNFAPIIEKAIDVPVVIASIERMTSKDGRSVHPMAYYINKKEIGVFEGLDELYQKKYKTMAGFDKYIKYVLFHEFAHSIDEALYLLSSSKKYRADMQRVAGSGVKIGNKAMADYFSTQTEYGLAEVFAEFSTVQDTMKKALTLKDIENLCYIKHKYSGGDRISWKEKRREQILDQAEDARKKGDNKKYKQLMQKSEEYIVTELDFKIQSPVIQNFLNCSKKKETLDSLRSIGIGVAKG